MCAHYRVITPQDQLSSTTIQLSLSPTAATPTPFPSGNHCCVLHVLLLSLFISFGLGLFRFHIWMKPYGIYLSLSWFISLRNKWEIYPCCQKWQDFIFVFFMAHDNLCSHEKRTKRCETVHSITCNNLKLEITQISLSRRTDRLHSVH